MSDNLRVGGQSSGPGFGKREGSLARFRRGRRAGDLVRGLFLRLEAAAPGTAWVNLEGEELLAQLPDELAALARRILAGRGVGALPGGPGEADFPLRTGSPCWFILERLEPEPLLRMLDRSVPDEQSATGFLPAEALLAEERAEALWREFSTLPAAQLAAGYATVRTDLDDLLQKYLWPTVSEMPERPLERMRLYRHFVRDGGEALELYAELALRRAALVAGLRPHGLRDLLFAPWLAPDCLAVELALFQDAFILQARLPHGLRLEARGRAAPGKAGTMEHRLLPPGEGDLLSLLLGLYPAGAGKGFSRRT